MSASLAEITDELATVRVGADRAIADVMPRIRELLGTEAIGVYGLADTGTHWQVAQFEHAGFPERFAPTFSTFLASGIRSYSVFDPGRPEPAQRNRVVEARKLVAARHADIHGVQQQVFEPLGIGEHGHLRTLLCEGASLLGWFGTLSREKFTARHRRILRAVAEPLRRRLLVERHARRDKVAAAAFEALLDAIPSPAFLLDARGVVREANMPASRMLAERGREVRTALVDALARRPTTLSVQLTRVHDRGAGLHWLAIAQIDAVQNRVAAAVQRYSFTPRESEVLTWLARGATNQRIAAELRCSERTVELHVTHLLAKANVTTRTALVALLFAPT